MKEIMPDQKDKGRLYEEIASEMENRFLNDPEAVGTPLPSEQTLANQYGVSRNVIREAFKVLKERGFIEVQNGISAHITRPGKTQVTDVLTRMMRSNSSDVRDVFEVRFALELSAVELATERADASALENLNNYICLMEKHRGDAAQWAEYDYCFHREIVAATGNRIYLSLFESISTLLKDFFEYTWGNSKTMSDGVAFHRGILKAIIAKDSKEAVATMKKHLTGSLKYYEQHISGKEEKP